MKKRVRIQGTFIGLGGLAFLVFSDFFLQQWKNTRLDLLWDFLGLGLLLKGFLWRIASRRHKKENSAASHKLVTDGPYRLTRNPMYFGTFLIGIGIILILSNGWALILFLAVFGTIYVPQMRREEERLEAEFGQEFLDYRKVTPKFLPGFFPFFSETFKMFFSLKKPWIRDEAKSLAAVLASVLMLETGRDFWIYGSGFALKELAGLLLLLAVLFARISLFS